MNKFLISTLLGLAIASNNLVAMPTVPNWHWGIANETSVSEQITVKFTMWWGDVITYFNVYANGSLVQGDIQTGASGDQIGESYPQGQVVEYRLNTAPIRSTTQDKIYSIVIEACNADRECIKGRAKQITVLSGGTGENNGTTGGGTENTLINNTPSTNTPTPTTPSSTPATNANENSIQTPGQPTLNFPWNPQSDPFTVNWTKWWGYDGNVAKLYINEILVEKQALSNYQEGITGQQKGKFIVSKSDLVGLGISSGSVSIKVELCYNNTCSSSVYNQNVLSLPEASELTEDTQKLIAPILSGVPMNIADPFTITIEKLENSSGNTIILEHTITKEGNIAPSSLYKIPVSSNEGQTVNISVNISKKQTRSIDRETSATLEDKLTNDRNFIILAPDGTMTLNNEYSLHSFRAFVCNSQKPSSCSASVIEYGQMSPKEEIPETTTTPDSNNSAESIPITTPGIQATIPDANDNLPGKPLSVVFGQVGNVVTIQMYRNTGNEGKIFKLQHINPSNQVSTYEFSDTPTGVSTQSIFADITIKSEIKEAGSWLDNVLEESLNTTNKIIPLTSVKPTIEISIYETSEHAFIPMMCNGSDCTKGDKIAIELTYTEPVINYIAPENPFANEENDDAPQDTQAEDGVVLDNPTNAPDSIRLEWVAASQESDFSLSVVKNYGKKLGDRWRLEDVVDGVITLYEFPATANGNEQKAKVNIALKRKQASDESIDREDEVDTNSTIIKIGSTEPTITLIMPAVGAQMHTFTFLLCNELGCSRSPSQKITIKYPVKGESWIYDDITREMMTWDFGDDSNPDFSKGAISVVKGKDQNFRLMMNPDDWDTKLKHEFDTSIPSIKHSLSEINNKIIKAGGFNGTQNYTAPTPVECSNKDEDGKINGKDIMVYYTAWSVYARSHYPSDLNGCNLTGILFAFAYPAPNGRLTIGDSYAALEANYEQKSGAFANDHSLGYLGVLNQLVSFKRKYPKVKTYLSVGGWTWSYALPYMAKYPKLRAQFVKDAVELLKTFQFDGIDIDWEFPDSVEIRENYVQLLRELRVALDSASTDNKPGFAFTANQNLQAPAFYEPRGDKYHLSIAVSPNPMRDGMFYDWAAINEQVDFVIYMAYDYAGAWGPQTGHQAPLYNSASNGEFPHYFDLNSTSDNYLRGEITTGLNPDGYNTIGLDAKKFILGLGYYGRGWAGVTNPNEVYQLASHKASYLDGEISFKQDKKAPGSWDDGVVDTKDLIKTYSTNRRNWTLIWDDVAKSTMAYGTYKGVKALWSYEDQRSICFKTQYAIEQGFGGVFAWESNGDDGSMLQTEETVIVTPSTNCYTYEPTGGYDLKYVNTKKDYITTSDIETYLKAQGKNQTLSIPSQLDLIDPNYKAPADQKGTASETPEETEIPTLMDAKIPTQTAIMVGDGKKLQIKPVNDSDRALRNEGKAYFETLDATTKAAVNKILNEIEFNKEVLSDAWTMASAVSAPNVARVQKLFSKEQYIKLFPLQNPRYNYETFIRSVHAFPKLCGEEGATDEDCKRELAFIFANMTQETSLMGGSYSSESGYTPAQWTNLAHGNDITLSTGLYGKVDPTEPNDIIALAKSLDLPYDAKWGSIYIKIPIYRQGLFHITEGSCLKLDGSGDQSGCIGREYRGSCAHTYFGEVWECKNNNELYYGRGAHQLTHSYNYGRFASFVWGAEYRQVLVDNPNYLIKSEPWLLMLSTTYFHMTPTGNKPSMHNLALGTWRPGSVDIAGKRDNTFGTAINVINGGLECGGAIQTAINRGNYYKKMAAYFGLPAPSDDYVSCAKQISFYRQGSNSDDLPPLYFYGPYETNTGHVNGSVPPKNTCALTGEETGFSIMQYDMSGYSECVKFNQAKGAY